MGGPVEGLKSFNKLSSSNLILYIIIKDSIFEVVPFV